MFFCVCQKKLERHGSITGASCIILLEQKITSPLLLILIFCIPSLFLKAFFQHLGSVSPFVINIQPLSLIFSKIRFIIEIIVLLASFLMMIPKKIKLHVIFKSSYGALGWAAAVASTHTAYDYTDLCSLESLLK